MALPQLNELTNPISWQNIRDVTEKFFDHQFYQRSQYDLTSAIRVQGLYRTIPTATLTIGVGLLRSPWTSGADILYWLGNYPEYKNQPINADFIYSGLIYLISIMSTIHWLRATIEIYGTGGNIGIMNPGTYLTTRTITRVFDVTAMTHFADFETGGAANYTPWRTTDPLDLSEINEFWQVELLWGTAEDDKRFNQVFRNFRSYLGVSLDEYPDIWRAYPMFRNFRALGVERSDWIADSRYSDYRTGGSGLSGIPPTYGYSRVVASGEPRVPYFGYPLRPLRSLGSTIGFESEQPISRTILYSVLSAAAIAGRESQSMNLTGLKRVMCHASCHSACHGSRGRR